jgi:hypothetical protein
LGRNAQLLIYLLFLKNDSLNYNIHSSSYLFMCYLLISAVIFPSKYALDKFARKFCSYSNISSNVINGWLLGGWWFVVDDSWLMIRGWWFVVDDSWLMIRGWWFVADDSWLMIRGWWFVVDDWWLMIGGWRLAVEGWRLKINGWRLMVEDWC